MLTWIRQLNPKLINFSWSTKCKFNVRRYRFFKLAMFFFLDLPEALFGKTYLYELHPNNVNKEFTEHCSQKTYVCVPIYHKSLRILLLEFPPNSIKLNNFYCFNKCTLCFYRLNFCNILSSKYNNIMLAISIFKTWYKEILYFNFQCKHLELKWSTDIIDILV